MSKIATIQEALDGLIVYGIEIERDFDKELKEVYKESINRAIYSVKQWGSHHTREEITAELNRRYGEFK